MHARMCVCVCVCIYKHLIFFGAQRSMCVCVCVCDLTRMCSLSRSMLTCDAFVRAVLAPDSVSTALLTDAWA